MLIYSITSQVKLNFKKSLIIKLNLVFCAWLHNFGLRLNNNLEFKGNIEIDLGLLSNHCFIQELIYYL
jgi:hypothetical protein